MATTPLFTSGNAKVVDGEAITMSQFMISQPPPKHIAIHCSDGRLQARSLREATET